jgi:folate-binding protein YgfZ
MSEGLKERALRKLPLHDSHLQLGAEFLEDGGWLLPGSYGDVDLEYAAVRDHGNGLLDLSSRGRLRISGSEAIQFLNGLITNDMKTLALGEWMPAVLPNVQGRLIASLRVVRLADEQKGKGVSPVFLLETEADTLRSVLENIGRFTMAGDFQVVDLSDSTVLLSVQGSQANELLASVFGEGILPLHGKGARTVQWSGSDIEVIHATHTSEDGYDLITNSEAGKTLWKALLREGARPVGFQAQEKLRIEAAIPKFGVDIDETLVVSETNLDEAISFTKGCYVGQEIIARIKYRGHVAKKIVGLIFDQTNAVESGSKIFSTDDKEIGKVTSVTFSPRLKRLIALALLKYQFLAAGTEVKFPSGDDVLTARVSETPFVRGSWFEGRD